MIHRVLGIGRWMVDFLFATEEYDEEGVLSCLYDADAPLSIMRRSLLIMESGYYNRGFTYSNPEQKRAVVVVGPTTSGDEFINTLVHELQHLSVAIASELGYDIDGETPAYIIGDTAQELFEVICDYGCEECRNQRFP